VQRQGGVDFVAGDDDAKAAESKRVRLHSDDRKDNQRKKQNEIKTTQANRLLPLN